MRAIRNKLMALGLAVTVTLGATASRSYVPEPLQTEAYPTVTTNIYEDWTAPEFSLQDLDYEHYDIARFEEVIETFLDEVEADPEAENIQAALDVLLKEYDYIYTLSSFIQFQYSQDVTDEDVAAEMTYTKTLMSDVFTLMLENLQTVQQGPHGQVFDQVIGEAAAEDLRESTGLTARQREIQEEISLLEQEFDKLDDETERKGEIYLELIEKRNEFAREDDYADYHAMNQAETYGRDFTDADLEAYYEDVKERVAPLYFALAMRVNWQTIQNYTYPSGQDAVSIMGSYLGSISSELLDSYNYMVENELYVLGDSAKNEQVSYTIFLPFYNSALIFGYNYGPGQNLNTLIHEFGHFNTAVRERDNAFFGHTNVDLAEIHSQGLELLFTPYAEAIYGKNANQQTMSQLLELVWAILTGALYNEFEIYAYTTPGVTVQYLNEKYTELSQSYGLGQSEPTGWMFWHMYHAPFYYLSYSLSAMAAGTLLPEMREDWRGAVDRYLKLTTFGEDEYPFREALAAADLPDIFDSETVGQVADTIRLFSTAPFRLAPEEASPTPTPPVVTEPLPTESTPSGAPSRPTIDLPEYGTAAPTPPPEPTAPATETPAPEPTEEADAWTGDPDLSLGERIKLIPEIFRYIWSGEFFSDLFGSFHNQDSNFS